MAEQTGTVTLTLVAGKRGQREGADLAGAGATSSSPAPGQDTAPAAARDTDSETFPQLSPETLKQALPGLARGQASAHEKSHATEGELQNKAREHCP